MRLVATYVFYADVYFIQNLILKVSVLYLALLVNKQKDRVNPIKIFLAGVLGTLFELLSLIGPSNFTVFILWINLIEIPLLVLFLLPKKESGCDWETSIKVSISALFFVIVLNGVIEAGYNLFGEIGHFIELVAISCWMVVIGTKQFLRYRKIQRGIYPIRLVHKGKGIDCRGLYDSGNTLKDPYSGVDVHIISQELKRKLLLSEEKSLLIPYSSLGNESDLMTIYYLDRMIAYGGPQKVELSHVAVGIGEEGLFQGKSYDLILNGNLW